MGQWQETNKGLLTQKGLAMGKGESNTPAPQHHQQN
jgi:hypothetical protein